MIDFNDPPLVISEEDYYENLKNIYGAENVFKIAEGHYGIKRDHTSTIGLNGIEKNIKP